jgi:hypothetical protein
MMVSLILTGGSIHVQAGGRRGQCIIFISLNLAFQFGQSSSTNGEGP